MLVYYHEFGSLSRKKTTTMSEKRRDKIKLSDAKAWLIKLQQADGRGYSSIHTIRGVLRPTFQMAENDDLIRKNPFQFELASVIVNGSVTREAVTRKQQREYLRFIQEDKHFCREKHKKIRDNLRKNV